MAPCVRETSPPKNRIQTECGLIDYLFEAHEVQPDDPALCLSLAVSTLGRSLGRRSDNRQQLIVQVHGSYGDIIMWDTYI